MRDAQPPEALEERQGEAELKRREEARPKGNGESDRILSLIRRPYPSGRRLAGCDPPAAAELRNRLLGVAFAALPARAGNDYMGQVPPEIRVQGWIHAEPMTLESQRGSVILLEYWATW